ncbi:MAG: putative LPS assembly protein LptD [Gemmatimonadota bacterium]
MRRVLLLLIACLLGSAALGAQGGGKPTRGAPVRTGADTLRRNLPRDTSKAARDSAAAADSMPKEIVKWAESDPVIDSLLARQGYTVTRFQGRSITFDASRKILTLIRDDSARAAIGRDNTIMVSDTIVYDDSTKIVRARGAENVLRDPARGGDDVVSRGTMFYNTTERRGTVGYVRTTIESGQKYFIDAQSAGFANDSLGVEAAFFGRSGTITTCDDSLPHYHFSSRELKLVKGKLAVGRPGVLHIYDVPVFWLPFYFQDVRSGRRSGMLNPRLGVSEIVRNGPLYRRTIENLGYYFNIDDYQDLQAWVDWRSGANIDPRNPNDFGFTRYNLQWRYNWLRRFLNGSAGASFQRLTDGSTNTNVQLTHQQRFSRKTSFNTSINYVSNTLVQRTTAFNPFAALATFRSSANYTTGVGPFTVALGANRTQYTGRPQVDQTLPSLNINSAPITAGTWLTWTPTITASETRRTNQQSGGQSAYRYFTNAAGSVDSIAPPLDYRNTTLQFNTPLELFGFRLDNAFDINDEANTGTQQKTIEEILDRGNGVRDTVQSIRFFDGFTQTRVDWRTTFSLPSFSRGKWNVSPSIQFANVDPGPFWVRSSLSGGRYVAQSKRPSINLAIAPTLFGFFPGVGPVTRIRHSFAPTLAWSVAPRGKVSEEYLRAINQFSKGYNGALPQNMVSLSLSQNVEVKLKAPADSAPEAGRKVRALSIQTDGLSYNFLQYQEIKKRSSNPSSVSRWAGLTTSSWGLGLRSDFLPGFDFGTRFSLFQGNPISDTAVFKPFREEIRTSLRLDRTTGVVRWIAKRLGVGEFEAAPSNLTATDSMQLRNDQNSGLQGVNRGLNGNQVRPGFGAIPSGQGWSVNLSYSSTRQRPPVGANLIQLAPVEERCASLLQGIGNTNPFILQECINRNGNLEGVDNNALFVGAGSPIIINPPIRALQVQTTFNITPKWATQYSTTYDAVRGQFAAQTVSLQRELHDWRAIFNFTQAPNGNFAFSFFIALKAQPDLKFDFNQQSFRRPAGTASP